MSLSATGFKESPFVLFTLNRAHRYQRNLAGKGIDSGGVNIFAERSETRAGERKERAGVEPLK